MANWLGQTRKDLGYSIQSKGFDGKRGPVISQYILLSMWIDGRRLDKLPFLIVELGAHDVILGSRWLAHYKLMIDSRQRRLVWPTQHEKSSSFSSPIRATLQYLLLNRPKPSKIHQRDVKRRDRLLKKEDKMAMYGARSAKWSVHEEKLFNSKPSSLQTEKTTKKNGVQECVDFETEPVINTENCRAIEHKKINICQISAPAFHLNLRCANHTLFSLSLNQIEQELKERESNPTMYDSSDLEIKNEILSKYHDFLNVFSKTASNTLPPHRSYDHKIELEGQTQLAAGPLYSMSSEELKSVHKYLLDNLDKGFIEPSHAPFSSPVLFVKKSDGILRFCIDFRKLNAITRKDRYPLPLIDETLARLNKAKIFTKLDIRQAFHRIRMHPDSEELTTFRTRYGSYKCKVLPFGLTNGPATYQCYMNDILLDYLDIFCTAYLDNILIYSENESDHCEHVRKVLFRLRKAGLQADIKKCEFDVKKTKYLGYIVSIDGLMVDPEKISVVKGWLPPKSVKVIQ